ncbi:MAG: hypothetical protein JWO69_1380 [Thermoleophilia bacterium]|nr:hypothetical protein [Thermoleophilia bacterium]
MNGDEQVVHEPSTEQEEALEAEEEAGAEDSVLGDLDDGDHSPEAAVAESLRKALETMRDESSRIAALETGDEQVQAAEQFAEDAGKLDEALGSQARDDDDARG